jgi:hypothetical protein
MKHLSNYVVVLVVGVCVVQTWLLGILSKWIYVNSKSADPRSMSFYNSFVDFASSFFAIINDFYISHLFILIYIIWLVKLIFQKNQSKP